MTSTALATIETLTAAVVFAPGGVEEIISRLETEVRAIPRDMTTDPGREAIRALAYKVARSKTGLDDLGKELVAGIKKQSAAIDAERRVIRERLDALRDEVRAPLTAWEEAEETRIADYEAAIVLILCQPDANASPAALSAHILRLEELAAIDWQEFNDRAAEALKESMPRLCSMRDASIQRERDAAELAELRQLKADREIADQAAAAAKAVADREAREAEAQAERDRIRAEQAQRDQEAAVARATAAAEAKAVADLARAEQATRDAEAATERAIQAERMRAAIAENDAKVAAAKREANKRHRDKIHTEIRADLLKYRIGLECAELVMAALIDGAVRHVSIDY
jgi:hypothetical protein